LPSTNGIEDKNNTIRADTMIGVAAIERQAYLINVPDPSELLLRDVNLPRDCVMVSKPYLDNIMLPVGAPH
jgi:hypothetical protein